jgi:hypothetical protein
MANSGALLPLPRRPSWDRDQNNVARRNRAAPHFLRQVEDLLNHQRRARQRLHDGVFWPRSMRRAISISPSRVSSGTEPISRRYMRTGSLILSPIARQQFQIQRFLALFEFLVEFELGSLEDLDTGPVQYRSAGRQDRCRCVGRSVLSVGFAEFVIKRVRLLLAPLN